jgi:hypothetical protein
MLQHGQDARATCYNTGRMPVPHWVQQRGNMSIGLSQGFRKALIPLTLAGLLVAVLSFFHDRHRARSAYERDDALPPKRRLAIGTNAPLSADVFTRNGPGHAMKTDPTDRSRPAIDDETAPPGAPTIDAPTAADKPPYERPTRPPWLGPDGTPLKTSPSDADIVGLAREIATASGPEALDHARTMLASEQAGLGVVAAALLVRWPHWDRELFEMVATHPDAATGLFALQGLLDAGRMSEATALRARLAEEWKDVADWSQWVESRALPGTAVRGLIGLLTDRLNAEERVALLDALTANEKSDYSARMRALLEFQNEFSFTEFRARVRRERDAVADENGLWHEGLERLAQRLDGPLEVHRGPPVLTPHDVDLMVAREYPAMYEDLALRLELLLRREDRRMGIGVTQRLREAVALARQRPLSNEEQLALQRIETLADQIEESDVSRLAPPPPPGS